MVKTDAISRMNGTKGPDMYLKYENGEGRMRGIFRENVKPFSEPAYRPTLDDI